MILEIETSLSITSTRVRSDSGGGGGTVPGTNTGPGVLRWYLTLSRRVGT